MYEIMICPLKRVYQLSADCDMSEVAVLAASAYDIGRDKLQGFFKKLCLHFADTTVEQSKAAFSTSAAFQITEFVKALPEDLDTLIVCCDSGESRSTAIAAAIRRYHGLDDMEIWNNPHYHPNPLVYKILCGALGLQATDAEVTEKLQVNQKILQKCMWGQ